MKLRKLFVEVTTKWVGEARLKAVKVVSDAAAASLQALSTSADRMADRMEAAASRAGTAMRDLGVAARTAGRAADAVTVGRAPRARSGAGGRRAGPDPLDAAVRRANVGEAQRAGLAAGAAAVTDATRALGPLAGAADRAKARIADLSAQVERNRRELAALKAQALQTGDADGQLAARMRGLAVATGQAQVELGRARRELHGLEGGLIAAIKKATAGRITFQALGTAAGNMISAGVSRGVGLIKEALVGAAGAAMAFETSLVDIQKVARGADETAEGMERIEAGIKAASKELGRMPNEVAQLAAQITPVFSGKEDIVGLTKDVTKIGVAWGVTGEEAGKFFADASRGLQMTAGQTKDLFGSINELSNQLGIRAADIAEAFSRSAGVIKASGLSAETGAALNATLIAAGASAEVAATGVRTFVSRMEAGAAATPKQQAAFRKLGLDAVQVGEQMAKGGRAAEDEIKRVVTALGSLPKAQQIGTLMELFGSESLGSIGAAATAADKLGEAFGIASGEAGNFTSVLKEYERASNTSAERVKKLKANIGVLAIEFGSALLPHIDKIVAFLTSPEGQEWGRQAVEKATEVVVGLASAIQDVASFLGFLVDKLGGTGVAVGGLGLAVAGLAGPFGLALAAGLAMGAGIATAIDSIVNRTQNAALALANLHHQAEEIRHKEKSAERDQQVAESEAAERDSNRERRIDTALELWEERERKKRKIAEGSAEDLALTRKRYNMREALRTGKSRAAGQSLDDAVTSFEASLVDRASVDKGGRFKSLLARRKRLKPSEKAELRRLSKELDITVPSASGSSTFTEEQSALLAEARGIDRNTGGAVDFARTGLSQRVGEAGRHKEDFRVLRATADNPALRAILLQGRERKKGVLGGAGNVLDKAIEEGLLSGQPIGVSGSRGSAASAGPAISNTYNTTYHQQATVNQEIHVESAAGGADGRIRDAGKQVAQQTIVGWQEAAVIFGGGPT